jgi:serine/threonine protein kinase
MASNPEEQSEQTKWGFEQGDEITPRYLAMKGLGGGHSYEVYLAQDVHRLALVVVKLLRPHLVNDDREKRSLGREIEVLERLSHPVIVRSFGSGLDAEIPHVVLEHLEGPHLSRLIRRHPLALEQIIPLAVQVASGIHYMAAEGLVHLDVKPRNIIMGAPPRLIDMSVARDLEAAGRISGAIGTDPYMAPEQCDPSRDRIGPPADVWGLGATLFHAVARKLPFPRSEDCSKEKPEERWPQLVREPDPLPDDTPRVLGELILDCLAPAPAERPEAADVIGRLEPLVATLPSRPVLRRLRPRLTRRKPPAP